MLWIIQIQEVVLSARLDFTVGPKEWLGLVSPAKNVMQDFTVLRVQQDQIQQMESLEKYVQLEDFA